MSETVAVAPGALGLSATAERSFAEKLDHLFRTVHPRGRRPFSFEVVAAAITRSGDEPISANYIWMLRKGLRDNPSKHHIEALAGFFGVPPTYFFDEEIARRVDAQLALVVAMRDAGVETIGLRAAGLTPESRQAIAHMADVATGAVARMWP